MKYSSIPISRRVLCATATATLLLCQGTGALAATPKDTLVIAFGFDDIITMDPAEAFELSAGEIMGNTYDRLVRLDVNDPSRLIGDVAKSWTVSPDGKTYTFELKNGLKFASGNPLTAEEVAYSLHRAVSLDKSPAFILTQFGFSKDNVKEKIKATGLAPVSTTGMYSAYPDAFLRSAYYNLAGADGWRALNDLTPRAFLDPRFERAASILRGMRTVRHANSSTCSSRPRPRPLRSRT